MTKKLIAIALVFALTCGCALAESLGVGSKGEDVRKAQERLIELGWLDGTADGRYGQQTAEAVRRFQKASGISTTGTIGQQTTAALYCEGAAMNKNARAQQRLIELGYLAGEADGIIGPDTEKAISLFQKSNALSATGKLDEATFAAIMSDSAKRNETVYAQKVLSALGFYSGDITGETDEATIAAIRRFQKIYGVAETGALDEATIAAIDNASIVTGALKKGSEGEGVLALQTRLIELGYMDADADGEYGKKTASAVSMFQRTLIAQGEAEISETGIATPLTQAYLFSPHCSTYVRDLQLNDSGEEVNRVENKLHLLGYMDGEPDGKFDDYTRQMVCAFQAAEGLAETGVADKAFVDRLFSAEAKPAVTFVAHDIAFGDTGMAVQAAQDALARVGMMDSLPDGNYGKATREAIDRLYDYLIVGENPNAAFFEDGEFLSSSTQAILCGNDFSRFVSDIDKGASKDEVRRLQRRLHTLYYLADHQIDGAFGDRTAKAISTFQENCGLPVTGIADEATQKVLFSADAPYHKTPYMLKVSIDDQRVYVFQLNEDKEYEQIDTFICSTGLGNSTPKGVFINTRPVNRWHHFEKFDCWAQYSYSIQGDIMFHSVLYSEKDTDTLREGSVWALGHKASHGCIRLKVSAASWIFNNCKSGTIVVIY